MKKNRLSRKPPALDIFYRVLSYCSIRCLFKIAKILAFIVSHTNNQLSRQTRQNIRLCFPELSRVNQQKLINESLHHTCCAFIELASLWNHPIENVLSNIKIKSIDEGFNQPNRTRIIIAPHHGSWELLNLWLAEKGPLYSLYKPGKSSILNQYVINCRSRNNANLVPANTTGLRSLLQGLKNKASCMILPDQKPAKNTAQIDAPFFGYPAATSLLIKRLAKKIDCDIFIASITRDFIAGEYDLTIQRLNREEFLTDDYHSASYLNLSIESLISKNVCQYQWAYRRFNIKVYSSVENTK